MKLFFSLNEFFVKPIKLSIKRIYLSHKKSLTKGRWMPNGLNKGEGVKEGIAKLMI